MKIELKCDHCGETREDLLEISTWQYDTKVWPDKLSNEFTPFIGLCWCRNCRTNNNLVWKLLVDGQ